MREIKGEKEWEVSKMFSIEDIMDDLFHCKDP